MPTDPESEDPSQEGPQFEEFLNAANAGDTAKAMEAMADIWKNVGKFRETYEKTPLDFAQERARVCEERHDWKGAEAAYREVISLSADNPNVYKAQSDICSLLTLLDREEEAFAAVQAACVAARGEPCYTPLLTNALLAEARGLLKIYDIDGACSRIQEVFDLIGDEELQNQPRSRAHVGRAELSMAEGNPERAEADLEAAWTIIEPQIPLQFMAGIQAVLAQWWRVSSALRKKQGDMPGAIEALRESVKYRRVVAQAPQLQGPYKYNNLAVTLHSLGQLLEEAGDPLAKYAFAESRTLRRSIGLGELE